MGLSHSTVESNTSQFTTPSTAGMGMHKVDKTLDNFNNMTWNTHWIDTKHLKQSACVEFDNLSAN